MELAIQLQFTIYLVHAMLNSLYIVIVKQDEYIGINTYLKALKLHNHHTYGDNVYQSILEMEAY